MQLRLLKVDRRTCSTDPLMPSDPLCWTMAELEAWHEHLAAKGVFPQHDRAWGNLLHYRDEMLEREVRSTLPSRVPPEVLAEAPLEWLAYRRYSQNPVLPMLAHRLSEILASISSLDIEPTTFERRTTIAIAKKWLVKNRPPGDGRDNTVTMVGGLKVSVMDGQLHVQYRDKIVAAGPMHARTISYLRRLITTWRRFVRVALGNSAQHIVPDARDRTIQDRIQLGIAVPSRFGMRQFFTMREGREKVVHGEPLSQSYQEFSERYALAGSLMRSQEMARQCEGAIDRSMWLPFGPFDSLTPVLRTLPDILSSLDDTSFQMIRPMLAGKRVAFDGAADSYQIMVDDITGPRLLCTVPALSTAVDIERSNRVTPVMRLSLGMSSLDSTTPQCRKVL